MSRQPQFPWSGGAEDSTPRAQPQSQARLERLEERLVQLENALRGVARESSISVDSACPECNQSLLLIRNDVARCPKCHYRYTF
ncbi:hypothetical protein [Halorientalis halophila]|uniref:hypothetical protein n=1 Tax=Halorientalis halophila TaxID=3108499 RepID=UPI003008B8B7